MRGRTAALEGEGPDAARIQARGLDRRELVGDEDRAPRQVAPYGSFSAGKLPRDLAGHVGDVGFALPHCGGVGGGQPLSELARHLGQRPLGVDPLPADALDDRAEVRLVGGDQAVRFEDGRELGAHVSLGLPGVPGQLLARARGGAPEALLLALELLGNHGAAERRQAAEAHDHGPPDGDPWRDGKPLEHGAPGRLLFLVETAGDQVLDGGESVALVLARNGERDVRALRGGEQQDARGCSCRRLLRRSSGS